MNYIESFNTEDLLHSAFSIKTLEDIETILIYHYQKHSHLTPSQTHQD